MGEQAVKNIQRPVRVFRLAFDPNGTTELTQDAGESQRLLKRAHEVLEYDYNNEGRDPRKSQEPRKSS